jgi:hypothetical protein
VSSCIVSVTNSMLPITTRVCPTYAASRSLTPSRSNDFALSNTSQRSVWGVVQLSSLKQRRSIKWLSSLTGMYSPKHSPSPELLLSRTRLLSHKRSPSWKRLGFPRRPPSPKQCISGCDFNRSGSL